MCCCFRYLGLYLGKWFGKWLTCHREWTFNSWLNVRLAEILKNTAELKSRFINGFTRSPIVRNSNVHHRSDIRHAIAHQRSSFFSSNPKHTRNPFFGLSFSCYSAIRYCMPAYLPAIVAGHSEGQFNKQTCIEHIGAHSHARGQLRS